MKPETIFRNSKVTPFLKRMGNTAYFPIQQASIGGDADFILCVCRWFVWLELKADDGILSPLQEYKASLVKEADGIVIVAKPKNWAQVKVFLQQLSGGIYDKNILQAIESA